jgi:SAM-dependent methyltransferase
LDVACGTGEHARHLSKKGFTVDGIDIEPGFVEIARQKSPGLFTQADMTTFDLGRSYDAVLCLFSSIGYVQSLEGVTLALARFRTHLAPLGIVIVEPWYSPEQMEDGKVHVHTADGDGVRVCRVSHTKIEGRISRLQFEYLIGRATGLVRAHETHELGLFRREEMEACFAKAGLLCEYDPSGPADRGLYVGRVAE